MREQYQSVPEVQNVKTVFPIHNARFQGQFTDKMLSDVLGLADIPAAVDQLRCDASSINFMKGALCYLITYLPLAQRMPTSYRQNTLRREETISSGRRQNVLRGILNGIDMGAWSPASDPIFHKNFSARHMEGKAGVSASCKSELGLEVASDVPLR